MNITEINFLLLTNGCIFKIENLTSKCKILQAMKNSKNIFFVSYPKKVKSQITNHKSQGCSQQQPPPNITDLAQPNKAKPNPALTNLTLPYLT